MNIPKKIHDLIILYCNNTITDSEKLKLNSWLQEDEGNARLFKKKSSLYYKMKFAVEINEKESVKDWKRLSEKINKKKPYREILIVLSQVAAIVLLVFVVNFFVERNSDNHSQVVTLKNGIKHGETKAYLKLESGEQIKIFKNSGKQLSKLGSINISQDSSGAIKYNNSAAMTNKIEYNTIIVPRGGEYNFTLSDGTSVWLNSASELKYPVNFKGKTRDVYLKGEGYFEVAHNKQKSFNVMLGSSRVKVLGTSFNVSAYGDDKKLSVALLEGKVLFKNNEKGEYYITPGKMLVMDKKSLDVDIKNVDIESIAAWKKGVFLFEDMQLKDIIKKMERWYDVEVIIGNQELKNTKFTGAATKYRDLNYLLRVFSKTKSLRYKAMGRSVYIYEEKLE